MMKKVSSLLLVLVMLLGICMSVSASEEAVPVWESDFSAGTLEGMITGQEYRAFPVNL